MINPPSVNRVYDDFWSSDPALIAQPDPPSDDADEAEQAAYKTLIEEYRRKFQRARETGDWEPIKVAGCEPTIFTLRPIKGHAYRAIMTRHAGSQDEYMSIAAPLAFRACIVKIANPSVDLKKPERHPEYGDIAPVSVTDYLDAIDMSIVTEIGLRCLERGPTGFSPKS